MIRVKKIIHSKCHAYQPEEKKTISLIIVEPPKKCVGFSCAKSGMSPMGQSLVRRLEAVGQGSAALFFFFLCVCGLDSLFQLFSGNLPLGIKDWNKWSSSPKPTRFFLKHGVGKKDGFECNQGKYEP